MGRHEVKSDLADVREDLQLEGVKLELAQLKSELSEVKKSLDEKLDAVLAMLGGKDINGENPKAIRFVAMRFSNAVKLLSSLVILLELPSSSEDISVPDLPTVDRAITIQNGGRCMSETSQRSKVGLRTGKERYILFITI